MPNRTNFRLGFHAGTDLSDPGQAADPAGTFYWSPASAPDRLFVRVPNGSDVLVEQEIALAVAPGTPGAWGNYVVSNDPDVDAPYTTLEAAVAAWEASGATRGVVLLMPGTYALPGGNLTVPDGLSLSGLGDSPDDVQLTGNLTLDAGAQRRTVSNLAVTGSIGANLIDGDLAIVGCTVLPPAGVGVDVLATEPGVRFELRDTRVVAVGVLPAVRLFGEMTAVVDRVAATAAAGNVAVSISTNTTPAVVTRATLTGTLSVTAAEALVQYSTVTAPGAVALRGDGAVVTVEWSTLASPDSVGPVVDGAAAPGDLLLLYRDVGFVGASVVGPNAETQALPIARPFRRAEGPAATALLTYPAALPDVFDVDASVSPTVNLPAPGTAPDGVRITIRSAARPAGGDITLAAQGGETVDGAATLVLTPPVGGAVGAEVQYDAGATPATWRVTGRVF